MTLPYMTFPDVKSMKLLDVEYLTNDTR